MGKDYVIVTTEWRGVFFGHLVDEEADARRVTLRESRNVIYWSGSRGFLGLASHGPEDGSRIGAEAQEIELMGVTSIALCSDEAVEKFKGWS